MNRAKALLVSLGLANSFFSTHLCTTNRHLTSQVTKFSSLFSSPSNHHYTSHLINSHQNLLFSSSNFPSNSVSELVLANEWSTELENELHNLNPEWTHGTVISLLKKLDKNPQKASDFFNWVCEKNGFRPNSSIYVFVLRTLARKESMVSFWIVLMKMKVEGFYIDKEMYLGILAQLKRQNLASDVVALSNFYNLMVRETAMDGTVKKVIKIVLGSKWSKIVEKQLEKLKVEVYDSFVVMILKELRNHPSKALNFFKWVGQFPGYDHNSVTYNAIARSLSRHDTIREFWSMIEEMEGAGHEMDLETYRKISRRFMKYKMMEDAVKLFEFMMDGPFKPSIQDCCRLLRVISASYNPDYELAVRVAMTYESAGYTLSKDVYDWIHRCLTGAGRFDKAEKIVNLMKTAGYEPDNITYSQLIYGLCKARRLEEARKVLVEMEGNGCTPDFKTWTVLIRGHCVVGELDKALICFTEMIERNCKVDADLIDVLINGFLTLKKTEDAYKLLIKIVDITSLKPLQVTYTNLIEKLLMVRKLKEALNLLRLMQKQGYQPCPDPFAQYISKFGTAEETAESLKEFPSFSAFVHVFK
ncbi:hypothetical protein UlMin_041936 [Ulmus minor]